MPTADVPSQIDLREMADALEWEATVTAKRPYRVQIFERIRAELATSTPAVHTVLELGSGPGFLAAYVLSSLPELAIALLDFSPAMQTLARRRLAAADVAAEHLERDFLDPGWTEGIGPFDAVVTLQAVHELRHKSRAAGLHAQVRSLLRRGGIYLVCDHFCGTGGMSDDRLFMTIPEQAAALTAAGFEHVDRLEQIGSLVLHRAA